MVHAKKAGEEGNKAGQQVAVDAAKRGWAVVKIIPGSKKAAEPWRDLEWRDPQTISDLWSDKQYSVGILTGPSRLVCDDLDVDEEGNPAGEWDLEILADGRILPRTFTLATPSGGTQLIWHNANGHDFKTCAGQMAPHIDVRGRGGLFVLWERDNPSRIITDHRMPISMPKWLSKLHPRVGDHSPSGSSTPFDIDIDWMLENGVDPGKQETALAHLTWELRAQGLSREITYLTWQNILARSRTGIDAKGNPRPRWTRKDFNDKWNGVDRKLAPVIHGLRGLDDVRPLVRGGIKSLSADDYDELDIEWLNKPFLPFGYLVMVDGDPGQGKSLITTNIVANAASGKAVLPVGDSHVSGPIHCGMIGAEDDIEESVIGRLRASGYVRNRHVWFMKLKRIKDKNGKKRDIEVLTFPDGIERVREFIIVNELRLLVIDPVSAFIGEDIQTHNDASVRRALGPLVDVAKMTRCCIILVRHLNKSGQMKAMYRGSGSIAFSGIARSGLITGELPDGRFGLAQVKCSYARRFKGTLTYSIAEWEDNEEIPIIDWHDEVETDADFLIGGPKAKKGPEPFSQNAMMDVLEQLFEEKDTWPQKDVIQQLTDAGCSTDQKTLDKVRAKMGIISRPVHVAKGKFASWIWTTQTEKQTVQSTRQDSKDSSDDSPFG